MLTSMTTATMKATTKTGTIVPERMDEEVSVGSVPSLIESDRVNFSIIIIQLG